MIKAGAQVWAAEEGIALVFPDSRTSSHQTPPIDCSKSPSTTSMFVFARRAQGAAGPGLRSLQKVMQGLSALKPEVLERH